MISPVKYINQVRQEIEKISWPTREQTQQKTLLVIGVCLGLAVYVGLLDVIFQRLMQTIL